MRYEPEQIIVCMIAVIVWIASCWGAEKAYVAAKDVAIIEKTNSALDELYVREGTTRYLKLLESGGGKELFRMIESHIEGFPFSDLTNGRYTDFNNISFNAKASDDHRTLLVSIKVESQPRATIDTLPDIAQKITIAMMMTALILNVIIKSSLSYLTGVIGLLAGAGVVTKGVMIYAIESGLGGILSCIILFALYIVLRRGED